MEWCAFQFRHFCQPLVIKAKIIIMTLFPNCSTHTHRASRQSQQVFASFGNGNKKEMGNKRRTRASARANSNEQFPNEKKNSQKCYADSMKHASTWRCARSIEAYDKQQLHCSLSITIMVNDVRRRTVSIFLCKCCKSSTHIHMYRAWSMGHEHGKKRLARWSNKEKKNRKISTYSIYTSYYCFCLSTMARLHI